MQAAPFAPDETGRLLALRELEILDTPPERRFDRIAQLAARLTGSEIGMIAFVDETRVFFKSTVGAAAAGVALGAPTREFWFCSHVVATGRPLVVEDAREDGRFDRIAAVSATPAVLAYAGVPLRAAGWSFVGTLAVLATEPRRYSEPEMNILAELARLVEAELSSVPHGTLDSLTGALNARTFYRLGNRYLELADYHSAPVAVLRIDVGGVEEIRARHGFEAADAALRDVAKLVGTTVRGSDLVGRLGPEEFGVVLLGADSERAKLAVERLVEAARQHNGEPERLYDVDLVLEVSVTEHTSGDGSDLEAYLAR